MKSKQYFGYVAIAEHEQMLVLNARRYVIGNIRDRHYFSIIADGAADIRKVSEFSIYVACFADV